MTTAAASAVTGVAVDLISRVQQSVGSAADSFAEVLAGTASSAVNPTSDESPAEADLSTASTWQQASTRIVEILESAGIDVNKPIEFRVQSDGSLQLASAHPRAAEIERHLSEDTQLQDLIARFRRTGGSEFVTLEFAATGGLTNGHPEANMTQPPRDLGGPGG